MSVVRYRIYAWLGQTATDEEEAAAIERYLSQRAAAGGHPAKGEPRHHNPSDGSPRPLRLGDLIRDIRRPR